eukprot:3040166-Ditylum_brightwellii.AAC.1
MSRLQQAASLAAVASLLLAYDRSSSTSQQKSLPSPIYLASSPANGQDHCRNTSFGTLPSLPTIKARDVLA